MTDKEFELLDTLAKEGLTNAEVLFVRDVVSTKSYFGVDADFKLTGKYVAIYYDDSKTYAWLNGFVAKHTPDIMFLQINENSHLFLYRVND